MKNEAFVITVRAPVWQAVQLVERRYEKPELFAEQMMEHAVERGLKDMLRFWREVWAVFMAKRCADDGETVLAIIEE